MKKLTLTLLTIALSGAFGHLSAQVWEEPYAPGSTADNIIRFRNGPDATIRAPLPGTSIGIIYNTTPATGTGGGWDLRTSGSASIGLVVPLGTSRAFTQVSNQNLNFGVESSGLNELVGLSLDMTWRASSTITGSDSWTPNSDRFRYNFSLVLSNSLVGSGNIDLFGAINLTISAGGSTLYNVTGLNQILGITSITNSVYDDAYVDFNYDPADGPLEISWSASSAVNLDLLNLLGGGTTTFYNVHSTTITADAIPEASTIAFLVAGGGLLGILQRRKR